MKMTDRQEQVKLSILKSEPKVISGTECQVLSVNKHIQDQIVLFCIKLKHFGPILFLYFIIYMHVWMLW